jgi:hypothetical protein
MDTNANPTPATPVEAVTAPAAPVVVETPAAPVAAVTPATPAPAAVVPEPAKKADTLKIPAGSFTHTDLARLNGKTNQQVWTRYQAMVKSGLIIRDGERKPAGGKGKPSLLWKVNPNPPANVTVPTIAPSAPVTQAADPNVVLPTEAQMEAAADAAPVVEAAAAPTEPVVETAAPAPEPPKDEPPTATPAATNAGEQTVTVEIARVEATPTPAEPPVIEPVAGIVEPVTPTIPAETPIAEACPACQHNLVARSDATGIMVGCNQPAEVCHTAERVEGHGATLKGAIATLHDKWDKLVGNMKPAVAH